MLDYGGGFTHISFHEPEIRKKDVFEDRPNMNEMEKKFEFNEVHNQGQYYPAKQQNRGIKRRPFSDRKKEAINIFRAYKPPKKSKKNEGGGLLGTPSQVKADRGGELHIPTSFTERFTQKASEIIGDEGSKLAGKAAVAAGTALGAAAVGAFSGLFSGSHKTDNEKRPYTTQVPSTTRQRGHLTSQMEHYKMREPGKSHYGGGLNIRRFPRRGLGSKIMPAQRLAMSSLTGNTSREIPFSHDIVNHDRVRKPIQKTVKKLIGGGFHKTAADLYHGVLQLSPHQWEQAKETASQMSGHNASQFWGKLNVKPPLSLMKHYQTIMNQPTPAHAARLLEADHHTNESGGNFALALNDVLSNVNDIVKPKFIVDTHGLE